MKHPKHPLALLLAALLLLAAALPAMAAPKHDRRYGWERRRTAPPVPTDLVLCYGGSPHRKPFAWTADRYAPLVTFRDSTGREQWLFDGFLCLEFQMGRRSLNLGQHLDSGRRDDWEALLDYWLSDPETGVGALERAVAAAAERLGDPPTKRRVVMVLPDPIPYAYYADTTSTTAYWGELDGRRLDFSKAEDRLAAYAWYVDRVRAHFDRARYRHIELAGFYIVSEDLATPGDGWNPELKQWEGVIPRLAEWLHALRETLLWIPYNRAAGYTRWRTMGIDRAYMQPNIFWGRHPDYTWERFFADVAAHDLAMELEFDEAVLARNPDCGAFRARLRAYMEGARTHGIYGTRPLAYYQGQNALWELARSTDPADRALYGELCEFVLNNPLRKQLSN